jgi:hypothetical protein
MAQTTKASLKKDPDVAPTVNAPQASDIYPGLAYGKSELAAAMRQTYDELIAFVTQPAFQAVYKELWELPATERPTFVNKVLLRPEELEKRGVRVPPEILIQTSAFGDRRPTLFAVKKFLPAKFHDAWENVNLTFDNEYNDEEVSRDPAVTWRKPLPVVLQNALIASNIDLNSAPDLGVDDPNWSFQLGKTQAARNE